MAFELSHLETGSLGFPGVGMVAEASRSARRPVCVISEEAPEDIAAREALLDAAFGPARFLKTCERLREGRMPARGLALVCKDEDRLVATMRMWAIFAGPGRPALLLGPLAVARDCRSLGIGAAMIEAGLARAAARNHRAVLLVGDAPYYARFGFDARYTEGLAMPGPVERERFLGLELTKGALVGASGRVSAAGLAVQTTAPARFGEMARAA
ncbi:GCN5 family N-acetyltransferase [Methylosinus sp. C49]|uniref:GNAT family N-acetyltransferase n=1 Tax=Methylosinus sp. C49 TaxID=2699395 RepID=UPI0013678ABD|nr:N-acetyltransferase [Methylosinus sp. C49]BBU60863.1 GCN5 family N-acetyltransferase [Methylosinus sp. C49]